MNVEVVFKSYNKKYIYINFRITHLDRIGFVAVRLTYHKSLYQLMPYACYKNSSVKTKEEFNKYIIISPSLRWDNASLLNLQPSILQKSFIQKLAVYIGVGKEGLGPSEIPHVSEVDANLLAEKIKKTASKNVRVYFDYLPQEDHATVSHQAIFNALRILYPLKN